MGEEGLGTPVLQIMIVNQKHTLEWCKNNFLAQPNMKINHSEFITHTNLYLIDVVQQN